MDQINKTIAIIGAGPVGLAAASHLAKRNIPFHVFEASERVGTNLLDWGHVKVFTPWKYIIDHAAEELLNQVDFSKPNKDQLPTGDEIVENYLKPLSKHPKMAPYISLKAKVINVSKKRLSKIQSLERNHKPFIIQYSIRGKTRVDEFYGIIDATGTYQNPNPIGTGSIFADGELQNQHKISYKIPDVKGKDLERYANKAVAVIGAGHSAINSLLELAQMKQDYPSTQLHWILQSNDMSKIYGAKEDDRLKARGALGIKIENLVNENSLFIHTPVFIDKITEAAGRLDLSGQKANQAWQLNEIDEIIANTGGRPDFSFLREVRYQPDHAIESVSALAELIDPNIHSCGTVRPHGELELKQPEKNFYIVGSKSYGRAPTFLMATGYEQVRSIAAWLDGDLEAARRVELDLPETGVCNSDYAVGDSCCAPAETTKSSSNSCCGPAEEELDYITLDSSVKPSEPIVNADKAPKAKSSCCG